VAVEPPFYDAPMSNAFRPFFRSSLFVLAVALNTSAVADEGMWLFNAPPLKQLKEKYHFEPTQQWLEHLQKASVRFNSGGSGSFVSANGLVITNHHVGADTLQKISNEQHNYLRDGFHASKQTDEIKSADLELNVLVSIEDVTARVNSAIKSRMSPDAAASARQNVIAQIEKESKDKAGL
jgi:S1-C subfamily serine protease